MDSIIIKGLLNLSKPFLFPGVSGIYSIVCEPTNKMYIGKSKSVGSRIGAHLFRLSSGNHANKYLQADYNKYGYDAFHFKVIEMVPVDQLSVREAFWFENYPKDLLYNIMPVYNQSNVADVDAFIEFINSKWLVSTGTKLKTAFIYRIVEDCDQTEIVDFAHKCNLFKLVRSKLTFLRVIKMMKSELGYTIITGRTALADGQRTYKLITNFDATKIAYVA